MNENAADARSRRTALALAAALTVTVFTSVAAVAGFSRGAAPSTPPSPVVATAVKQAPVLAPAHVEEDD